MKKLYFIVPLFLLCVCSFAQVPIYNSFPSAQPVIFLDFDGHHVSGTSWNWNGPFTCGPANLTPTQIKEVFERVAEDFRPFNINVTTDSTLYWKAPYKQRTRVILTVTNEWYGSSAGGVASTGSFSRGDNTPCFVFTKLHKYNVKNIAEAASHEAGHTLGLRHQAVYDANCVRTSDYNWGVGAGETGWAPIMGAGYNRNFTVWHKGSSSLSCTSVQSDLEVITSSKNGLTFRDDDHADLPDSATHLAVKDTQFVAEGLVAKTDDRDMFRFTLNKTSQFRLSANPQSVGDNNNGSNLDMQVSLFNSSETMVGSYNPMPILSSIVDTVLLPGTYYLQVEGKGNQYAPEYGSLGSYSLKGVVIEESILPLRQLTLQGKAENGKHQLKWTIDADERIKRLMLEASQDGRVFTRAKELTADERSCTLFAPAAEAVQYRLNVLFENGQQYYSNALVLRNTAARNNRPHLASNMISGSTLRVISPATYTYAIADFTGKVLATGKVQAGNTVLETGYLTAGMYLIKFKKDGEEYVEKFVKN